MTARITVPLKDRLRVAREEAGISKELMGDTYPMSKSRLNDWEAGRFSPSPNKRRRWAEVIAQLSERKLEEVLEFIDGEPVLSLSERRRNERRTPPRKGKGNVAWITAARKQKIFAGMQSEPVRRLAA